jgi:hypothetical protein
VQFGRYACAVMNVCCLGGMEEKPREKGRW